MVSRADGARASEPGQKNTIRDAIRHQLGTHYALLFG